MTWIRLPGMQAGMPRVHPSVALRESERTTPIIPACEHIAGRERFMRKALALQESSPVAFDVTLDLEDGAPLGREAEQARLVQEILMDLPVDRPHRVGVRVHDVMHPHFFSDLETVLLRAGQRVSYVVLPKAKNRGEVEYFTSVLHDVAKIAGQPPWRIHVLVESQRALQDVVAIAGHPEVETLDFGAMDFISDHGGAISESCMRSPDQFEHALLRRAKTQVVSASLLFGVVPVHNVTVDVDRPEQAGKDAARARREFGFLRMWSIHPDQIEPIVTAMAPEDREVERAVEVLLAAQDKDWAPVRHEGLLQDRASYRLHWAVLQRAHLAGRNLTDDIRSRLL